MEKHINTIAALEACVGARPAAADLKIIDHLDPIAQRWLAAASLACLCLSHGEQIGLSLAGGAPGFASSPDSATLRLSLAAIDDVRQIKINCAIGALFLIAGMGETLRINGIVQTIHAQYLDIAVRECYGHCAKALLRSDFWHASQTPCAALPSSTQQDEKRAHLAATRFIALATSDGLGHADISPKGDPAGLLVQEFKTGVIFADRPGNRRTDSLRNLLTHPHAAAALIIPGQSQVAIIHGRTQLRADPSLLANFAVNGKTPKLITYIETSQYIRYQSGALARAAAWVNTAPPPELDAAELFSAHIKLNKTRSLSATLARSALAIPGLMRKGLQQDYKRNLY